MMAVLENYNQFDGLHWETGSVRNYFAYRGVNAPHTEKPYTEALLMGISGGVVMGYFSFAYEGYDPILAILTRNTFDPLDTLLERLGVVQHLQHTSKPEKGLTNLIDTLENGEPAIVWADMFSLPYNAHPLEEKMWGMMPLVVYGYDEQRDTVWIADRAHVPLTITTAELAEARSRVKKTKFRILTLDPPNQDKLPSAVQKGIWDCIQLFTDRPPKGSKSNFGFAAYNQWSELLTKPKLKQSWANVFPPGRKMYAGLTSGFTRITTFGNDGYAERDKYADFLDEASVILDRPALQEVANQFRKSATAWNELGIALLPDEPPVFKETRELELRKHQCFLTQGNAGLPEILQINKRLDEIKVQVTEDFPLTGVEVTAMYENLRSHVLKIHDIELEAVAALQDAMA
jgi:hypothetical protein